MLWATFSTKRSPITFRGLRWLARQLLPVIWVDDAAALRTALDPPSAWPAFDAVRPIDVGASTHG
jgi:hypothetical protein